MTHNRIWKRSFAAILPVSAIVAAIGLAGGETQNHNVKANNGSRHTSATDSLINITDNSSAVEEALPAPVASDESSDKAKQSSSDASAQVTVNGRDVQVPTSGVIHKTITDSEGVTKLDVVIDGQQSSSSSSSVDIQIDSESSSSVP